MGRSKDTQNKSGQNRKNTGRIWSNGSKWDLDKNIFPLFSLIHFKLKLSDLELPARQPIRRSITINSSLTSNMMNVFKGLVFWMSCGFALFAVCCRCSILLRTYMGLSWKQRTLNSKEILIFLIFFYFKSEKV